MSTHETCFYFWRWGFWFRILGYGLHIKPSNGHVKSFSERHGFRQA